MKNDDVVITCAKRTPIGSFNGSLSKFSAAELGSIVIKNCITHHSNLKKSDIDMVYMGQVLQAGTGQNPARQAAIGAGIPKEKTSTTINQVCGSGLSAVTLALNSLKCEDAKIIIAGGQESMSNAPEFFTNKNEKKNTMIIDGLWDFYNNYHMGVTAENVALKYKITREEQDEFAFNSQKKASAANLLNKFKDEIVDITIKPGVVQKIDEHPRTGTTIEKLSKLETIFKENGTVTAGNSSGINDGAAALILMSEKVAREKNMQPLAKIKSWAQCGVDPSIMGTGPIPASKAALKKAGWKVDDLDLIESNEAFASQSIAVIKELGLDINKVNVNGGAIALGHPIGASGARILVTLIHEMQKRKVQKGLATLCIGGGMGIAMCIENNSF